MMQTSDILQVAEIGVAILGFSGIFWGLRQQARAIRTQSAIEFSKLYVDIFRDAPEEMGSRDGIHVDGLDQVTRKRCVDTARNYFGLLSVEWALHREGSIPQALWREWQAIAIERLRRPLWRELWAEVRAEFGDSHRSDFTAWMDGLTARALKR